MGNAIPARKLKRVHHALAFRTLARTLSHRAITSATLAAELDVSRTTALKWIQLLHARTPGKLDNLIYVEFWRKPLHPGYPLAFYTWGYGKDDAPRPLPATAAETRRKWLQKKLKALKK